MWQNRRVSQQGFELVPYQPPVEGKLCRIYPAALFYLLRREACPYPPRLPEALLPVPSLQDARGQALFPEARPGYGRGYDGGEDGRLLPPDELKGLVQGRVGLP